MLNLEQREVENVYINTSDIKYTDEQINNKFNYYYDGNEKLELHSINIDESTYINFGDWIDPEIINLYFNSNE